MVFPFVIQTTITISQITLAIFALLIAPCVWHLEIIHQYYAHLVMHQHGLMQLILVVMVFQFVIQTPITISQITLAICALLIAQLVWHLQIIHQYFVLYVMSEHGLMKLQ
jgi:hypothetical protein